MPNFITDPSDPVLQGDSQGLQDPGMMDPVSLLMMIMGGGPAAGMARGLGTAGRIGGGEGSFLDPSIIARKMGGFLRNPLRPGAAQGYGEMAQDLGRQGGANMATNPEMQNQMGFWKQILDMLGRGESTGAQAGANTAGGYLTGGGNLMDKSLGEQAFKYGVSRPMQGNQPYLFQ